LLEACLAPKAGHLAKYQDCVPNNTSCDKNGVEPPRLAGAARLAAFGALIAVAKQQGFLELWIFALLDGRLDHRG
jgi:hypothetical protein